MGLEYGAQLIDRGRVSPAQLSIDGDWLIILDRHVRCAWPEEGCALLLGPRSGAAGLRVSWVWPCLNSWRPDPDQLEPAASRCNRFAVEPGELVAAQRWGRERGWQVLGSAHSHPSGGVEPSALDLAWGWDGCLMLIRGLDPQAWGFWWLQESATGLQPRALSCAEALGD